MIKCHSRIYQMSYFHGSLDSTSATSTNQIQPSFRALHTVHLPMDKKDKLKERLPMLAEKEVGTFMTVA